jgi:hypothetical protein
MPCDKTKEGLEGIGFWDFLMGDFSPFEDDIQEESTISGSGGGRAPPKENEAYSGRINSVTLGLNYQFPFSRYFSPVY